MSSLDNLYCKLDELAKLYCWKLAKLMFELAKLRMMKLYCKLDEIS